MRSGDRHCGRRPQRAGALSGRRRPSGAVRRSSSCSARCWGRISAWCGCCFSTSRPIAPGPLAWHKDLTIAVRDNTLPSEHFCKPTSRPACPTSKHRVSCSSKCLAADPFGRRDRRKRAAPHSAGLAPLGQGGGCRADGAGGDPARAGDVLAMRPLVSHSSGASRAGTPVIAACCIWSSPAATSCPTVSSGTILSVDFPQFRSDNDRLRSVSNDDL